MKILQLYAVGEKIEVFNESLDGDGWMSCHLKTQNHEFLGKRIEILLQCGNLFNKLGERSHFCGDEFALV